MINSHKPQKKYLKIENKKIHLTIFSSNECLIDFNLVTSI